MELNIFRKVSELVGKGRNLFAVVNDMHLFGILFGHLSAIGADNYTHRFLVVIADGSCSVISVVAKSNGRIVSIVYSNNYVSIVGLEVQFWFAFVHEVNRKEDV